VNLKLIFGLGVGLAIAGLALSFGPNLGLRVIGSFLTLGSILCATAIITVTAKIPFDRDLEAKSKPAMMALTIFAMALAAVTLVAQFKNNAWHHQALTLTLFCVSIVLLLIPRSQEKFTKR